MISITSFQMKPMWQVIKMKKKLSVFFLIIISIGVLSSCHSNSNNTAAAETAAAMAKKGMVPINGSTFKTGNGWGYSITVDNKLFIRQTQIPAIEGNKGFASQEDAAKVAELVIKKLAKNENPAVTKEDLKQLGIIQ